MRKYLGWVGVLFPLLSALVVAEVNYRVFTIVDPRYWMTASLFFGSYIAGACALACAPFRSLPRWVGVLVYLLVIPMVMFAIILAVEGINFGS